jgi:hypothetical protein
MLKRFLDWIVPALVIGVIWVCARTARPVLVNWHVVEGLEREGRYAIIAAWHNSVLYLAPFLGKRLRMRTIISKSRDGEAITRVVRAFGHGAIRGSTSRDALSALRESLRALREGHVGITPDGPRGPRYVVQAGAAALAQLSGAPVVPMSWAQARPWEFGSWDRMKLPRPFARIFFMVGDPLWVGRDEDPEHARPRIERAMRQVTRDADRIAGGSLTGREPLLWPRDPVSAETHLHGWSAINDRKNIVAALQAALSNWGPEHSGLKLRAYLFGSRFRGDHRAESDLDLALEFLTLPADGATGLWIDVHAPTEARLTELLGVPVDLELYSGQAGTPTIHEALKRGSQRIWEGETT